MGVVIPVEGEESDEKREWPSSDTDSTDVDDLEAHVLVEGMDSGRVGATMDTRGEELGV